MFIYPHRHVYIYVYFKRSDAFVKFHFILFFCITVTFLMLTLWFILSFTSMQGFLPRTCFFVYSKSNMTTEMNVGSCCLGLTDPQNLENLEWTLG